MRSSFDSGMVYMVFFNVLILVIERIIYLQNPVKSGQEFKAELKKQKELLENKKLKKKQ